jgi:hypothetical protein
VYTHVMRTDGSSPLTLFSEVLSPSFLPLSSRDKKRHGFVRRVISPVFGQTFLRELEPTIAQHNQTFVASILEEARELNGLVDVSKWIDYFTFDVWLFPTVLTSQISGALSLGQDFKALETRKYDATMKSITARWTFVSQVCNYPS